jgi:hypothetical protein
MSLVEQLKRNNIEQTQWKNLDIPDM